MFHWGAYHFYGKHYTWGRLDPRALVALAGLSLRATLLTLQNHFLPEPPAAPVPQPVRAESALDGRIS